MKTYFEQYNEFADACELPKGNIAEFWNPNRAAIQLAQELVEEEYNRETKTALAKYLSNPSLENLAEVADGIGDSIYVLCQLARSLGVPLDRVWNAIQTANMAKVVVGADGKQTVKRREDGKILKPEGWTPPNIWQILFYASQEECGKQGVYGGESWKGFSNLPQAMKKHLGEPNG